MTAPTLAEVQDAWRRDFKALREDLVRVAEESARQLLAAVIHERREVAEVRREVAEVRREVADVGALVADVGALVEAAARRVAAAEAAAASHRAEQSLFRDEQRHFNMVALRYLEASVVVPGPLPAESDGQAVEATEGREQ
jgi:hypothetical protein